MMIGSFHEDCMTIRRRIGVCRSSGGIAGHAPEEASATISLRTARGGREERAERRRSRGSSRLLLLAFLFIVSFFHTDLLMPIDRLMILITNIIVVSGDESSGLTLQLSL